MFSVSNVQCFRMFNVAPLVQATRVTATELTELTKLTKLRQWRRRRPKEKNGQKNDDDSSFFLSQVRLFEANVDHGDVMSRLTLIDCHRRRSSNLCHLVHRQCGQYWFYWTLPNSTHFMYRPNSRYIKSQWPNLLFVLCWIVCESHFSSFCTQNTELICCCVYCCVQCCDSL